MAFRLLVALSLAILTQAWPQIPRPGPGSRLRLPVDEVVDESLVTLPITQTSHDHVDANDRVSGRQLPVDEDDTGSFMTLPVIHSTKRGLFSRQIEMELANRSDIAYYAQLNIGTPPQSVYVQLDTGSFELWVNPDCTGLRPADRRFCEAAGNYDPSISSTSSDLGTTASLRYGIGSANITYHRDDVSLGSSSTGMVLSQIQFGTATSTMDKFAGILGLGYGQNYSTRYPTLIDELVSQRAIRTKAFSLALGSKDEGQGQLILGGIDPAKFHGSLTPVAVLPAGDAPDGVARYWVSLEGIALTPPSGRSRTYNDSAIPVFLDSGATMTLLPPKLADAIAADFGVPGPDANGFYPVDCRLVAAAGTLDFAFRGGVTVPVAYREMIRELRVREGEEPRCVLGVMPSDEFVLLGDTFLRSAYAVFDLESHVVHMAPYTNCGSRAMTIRGSEFIGAIVGLCSSSSVGGGDGDGEGDGDGDDGYGGAGAGTGTGAGTGAGANVTNIETGSGVTPTLVPADGIAGGGSGGQGDTDDGDIAGGNNAESEAAAVSVSRATHTALLATTLAGVLVWQQSWW